MAIVFHSLHPTFPLPPLRTLHSCRPAPSRSYRIAGCSSSSSLMDPQDGGRRSFMEFPYVSAPQRELMVELVSTLESRLKPYLLPCNLPPDVEYYQNESGSAHASLLVRSGLESSPIDFVLGSWIHCDLPSGGALNITSLSAYLNSSTDAPNFLVELIRSSATSLVLILDLPPRKELVLHPDYLKTFYEDTNLDKFRQQLTNLPEVRPYFSSSLYIRSVLSPTAIAVLIETEAGKSERMEEIVRDHLRAITVEMLGVWLDDCACEKREVGENERDYLSERDQIIKKKTVEIDLGSSFPRLFGSEVAARVLDVLRGYFKA